MTPIIARRDAHERALLGRHRDRQRAASSAATPSPKKRSSASRGNTIRRRFHIDPEAAKHSIFGGLIASGWHTAAIWMKLAIAEPRANSAGQSPLQRAGVSPGFEDLRMAEARAARHDATLLHRSHRQGRTGIAPDMGLVEPQKRATRQSFSASSARASSAPAEEIDRAEPLSADSISPANGAFDRSASAPIKSEQALDGCDELRASAALRAIFAKL